MSRPRKAFGQQPGRLAATMLRALSAELSDPGRYSRGKGYARDGAVIDIEIRVGEVVGQVLGSRRDAYRVLLQAVAASIRGGELGLTEAANVVALIPDRTEMSVRCSCPDGDGGMMCKHAIAVLLVFADEVSIEPELLSVWRGGSSSERVESPRHAVETASRVDVLASMLASPAPLPPLANLRSLTVHPITTPKSMRSAHTDLLDELLTDALAVIRRR